MDHSWGYGSEQRNREKNEDCYGVFDFPEYTLAVVCDGMGGHVGGAHASTLAVRTLHDAMRELQNKPVAIALEEAIQRTNLMIYESARKNHRLTGMGTTIVAAVITRDSCLLAHVGDSRAYLVRRGQVQLLTRDHTMVNLFVDAELLSPEDAATHPEAHVLSRSLGVERQVEVDLSDPIPLEAGDVVFLCSDGVHGVVTDWELGNVDWGAPHEATHEILHIVTSREGDDNATAVSVMMGGSIEDVPPTPVPEPRRFDEAVGAGGAGMTAVPVDEDLVDDNLMRRNTPQSGGSSGGYAVYDDPILEPDEPPAPEPARPVPQPYARDAQPTPAAGADTRKPKAAQPARPKPAAPKPRRRTLVTALAVGAVLFLAVVTCGLGSLLAAGFVKIPSFGSGGGGGVAVAPAPVPPSVPDVAPVAPAPQVVTPEQEWLTTETLRASGDLAAAADVLSHLVATSDTHPFGDRALLALLDVRREMLEKGSHAPDAKPTDAPVEQTLDDKTVVYSLTPDRRAWVEAANAVLSHTFTPSTDLNGPNLAKQADDARAQVMFELGEMMCNHHRYDEARTRLRYLMDNLPSTGQAKDAKNLPKLCQEAPDNSLETYPCPTGGFLVKSEMPPPPRRLTKASLSCNQPPPGGQFQTEAIQRQRAGDCPASLLAVQAGMKVSVDHCRLYSLAWSCFNENDLRPLETSSDPLVDWEDLVLVMQYLEGSREKREAEAKDPQWARFPQWFREAPDGLEFRLEQWSKDPKMQEATEDLFGAPTVADQLTKDLFIEGRIAVQLACTAPEDRTSKVASEEAWARRVYVLARALHGPAGVLIKENRRDDNMQTTLRAMLNRAVTAYVDDKGRRTPIPDVVQYAYDVGIENRPPPGPAVKASPQSGEPVIRSDDDLHITIERGAGQ